MTVNLDFKVTGLAENLYVLTADNAYRSVAELCNLMLIRAIAFQILSFLFNLPFSICVSVTINVCNIV